MYQKHNLIKSICLKTNFRVGNQLRPPKKFSGHDLGRYRYLSQVKRLYKVKKRKTLSFDTFLQGFWICNQIFKFPTLKFWPYIAIWPEICSGSSPNLDQRTFLGVWADFSSFNWSCDKWIKLDHTFYIFLDPVKI